MDHGKGLGSAPVGIVGFSLRFDTLPVEIWLEVVSHTAVGSAIQITRVSNLIIIILGT